MGPKPKTPEAGAKFNRLTFVAVDRVDSHGNYFGRFLCDCGAKTVAAISEVRLERTKSCGCFRRDSKIRHGETVGGTRTPEYRAWKQMRRRCSDPRAPRWSRYGGRGIRVCKQWDENFEAFLAHVGRKPSPQHTIDRIDSDGDYAPGNCRWATSEEQNFSRNYTWKVLVDGVLMSVPKAAASRGLKYHTVRARLQRGLSIEAALVPVQQ